jgi:tetratricopeptide (TPR) repeat protein
MCGHLALVVGLTLAIAAWPSPAGAQLETFVLAVRDLAAASAPAEPGRSTGVRAAANRMGAALVQWDRTIAALETRVHRESRGASDQRASQLHVELGVAYRTRGRRADAMREFDAAVALQPAASDLQVLRALTLEAAGRAADAANAFQMAWTLDPGNPVKAYYVVQRSGPAGTALRNRARAFLTDAYTRLDLRAGRPAAMPFLRLGAIADNASRTPVVADGATAEGFALLGAGRYSEAVAALTRAGPSNPANTEPSPAASFALGQGAEAQGRVAEAREAYQAALAGALVGRGVLYVGLARLAQVEGDTAGAVEAFAHAAQLNPNDSHVHREFAGAYAAQGRWDEAFAELMAALLIDPRDAHAHAAIGQLDLDTGRDAHAVTALRRALEVMPDRFETRYALAAALRRLGKTAEAAQQLEIFEHARQAQLQRRRREIARDVEQEEAVRRGTSQSGVR